MDINVEDWKPFLSVVWPAFCKANPELLMIPKPWAGTNFLRVHRPALEREKVIVKALIRKKTVYADSRRFNEIGKACALGLMREAA